VEPPVDLERPVHPHHGRAPQARRARPDPAHPSPAARPTSTSRLRGLVLRGLRAVQARERDRRRPLRAASHARAGVDAGAELVLPPERVPGASWSACCATARVPAAGEPPQRDPRPARAGAGGHLDHAARAGVGPSPSPSSRPTRAPSRRARGCGSTRCPTTSPPPASPRRGTRRAGPRSCTWWARTSRACTAWCGRPCSRRRGCRCRRACGRTAS
jgi:hypothetical protein